MSDMVKLKRWPTEPRLPWGMSLTAVWEEEGKEWIAAHLKFMAGTEYKLEVVDPVIWERWFDEYMTQREEFYPDPEMAITDRSEG